MQTGEVSVHAGSVGAGMLRLMLMQNREDRPRYVTLVQYEQWYRPVDDEMEALALRPIRRTWEWVSFPDGRRWVCTRVTELSFRFLKPTPAHRDLIEQWLGHLKANGVETKTPVAQKLGAKRKVKVEVKP